MAETTITKPTGIRDGAMHPEPADPRRRAGRRISLVLPIFVIAAVLIVTTASNIANGEPMDELQVLLTLALAVLLTGRELLVAIENSRR